MRNFWRRELLRRQRRSDVEIRGVEACQDNLARTRSLKVLPSTVLPSRAALADFTTAPICLMEVAPVSAMALAMAASLSASRAPAGSDGLKRCRSLGFFFAQTLACAFVDSA